MNQSFDFRRFRLLVLKRWADNRKRYVLSLLALMGLLAAWFVFTMLVGEDKTMSHDMQRATYFFSLFITGILFASQYYRDLSSRTRAIHFLMLPASAFEKFLCSLLYTVVLFFIAFTAAFYFVDFLMISLYNGFFESKSATGKTGLVNVFRASFIHLNSRSALNFLAVFFSVQSVFLFGSVFFRKYNFLKTVIGGFLTCLVGAYLAYLARTYLFPEANDMSEMPAGTAQTIVVLMYVIAPLFWILTYYRLKAKQV